MSEFTRGAGGTKRHEFAEPVAPPRPVFGDRPPLVILKATFRAAHGNAVGILTAGRRARHEKRLRLVCTREKAARASFAAGALHVLPLDYRTTVSCPAHRTDALDAKLGMFATN
jgi:hypothetical protein